MPVEERRRQFFEFFRTRAGAIAALQAPEPFRGLVDFESLRTTLVCAQLEALAKARYASREEYGRPTQRSGGRFRHLLEEHSECGDIYRLVALGRLHAHLAHAAQHARALTVRPDGKQMPASTMEAEACEEAARVVRWLLDRRGWDEARTMSRILDGTDLDLGTEAVQAALRQRGLDVLPKPVARAIHENPYAPI